jgi:hypothetical protein
MAPESAPGREAAKFIHQAITLSAFCDPAAFVI